MVKDSWPRGWTPAKRVGEVVQDCAGAGRHPSSEVRQRYKWKWACSGCPQDVNGESRSPATDKVGGLVTPASDVKCCDKKRPVTGCNTTVSSWQACYQIGGREPKVPGVGTDQYWRTGKQLPGWVSTRYYVRCRSQLQWLGKTGVQAGQHTGHTVLTNRSFHVLGSTGTSSPEGGSRW